MRRLLASALFAVIAGLCAQSASAGAFMSDRVARFCEDPYILNKIVDRFRHQVFNVPHLPNVTITEFRDIHEQSYLPYYEDSPIARRYCGATAALSDGDQRPIWYLIEDGMGFVGLGDNVEFCVLGFDRWLVYNGACRILRSPGYGRSLIVTK